MGPDGEDELTGSVWRGTYAQAAGGAEEQTWMNDRWLPVVAAILGVLGGVAGVAVGGYIANKGQEQRFDAERASRMLDQRIDAYVRFLRAAENEADEASLYPFSAAMQTEAAFLSPRPARYRAVPFLSPMGDGVGGFPN